MPSSWKSSAAAQPPIQTAATSISTPNPPGFMMPNSPGFTMGFLTTQPLVMQQHATGFLPPASWPKVSIPAHEALIHSAGLHQWNKPNLMTGYQSMGYSGMPYSAINPNLTWDSEPTIQPLPFTPELPGGRVFSDHQQLHGSSCWDNPAWKNQSYDQSHSLRMDASCFNGSEASTWIARVQYYFDHLMLPDDHRLHYVVMLFDPPAADWVFNYRANNSNAWWKDFMEDVRRRFDPQCFQNFVGLIAKLCQTGSLATYNTEFESMLNKVKGVPEHISLPIYVEGLQQPVRNQVKHQHPSSVAAAMALAVEFHSCVERSNTNTRFQRRNWNNREQRMPPTPPQSAPPIQGSHGNRGTNGKPPDYTRLPVIRLSAAERAERFRKGICWYCPEKYEPGHVCKKKFLAYMGMDEDDEELELPKQDTMETDIITQEH